MISRAYIAEWRNNSPWKLNAQVEQDLIIERAIVAIFNDNFLCDNLAFRGGTALHKIFLKPPARYSEDIDLVQINPGPIKDTIQRVQDKLMFIGETSTKQKKNNNNIFFHYDTEIPPVTSMKLKVEINCREHFTEFGHKKIKYQVDTSWFSGSGNVVTYELEEILGTKLRALYQRSKGRDLFDLFWALTNTDVDTEKVLQAYYTYMNFSVSKIPGRKQFMANMDKKINDPEFIGDILGLLRPGIIYDNMEAFEIIRKELLENL